MRAQLVALKLRLAGRGHCSYKSDEASHLFTVAVPVNSYTGIFKALASRMIFFRKPLILHLLFNCGV